MKSVATLSALCMFVTACSAQPVGAGPDVPFKSEVMATFEEPWAMTFLPGTETAVVTEKGGRLLIWERGKKSVAVSGVPKG